MLGHETMGEVVRQQAVGDWVVVSFTISCRESFFCKLGFYSGCKRSNPNDKRRETHLVGGPCIVMLLNQFRLLLVA